MPTHDNASFLCKGRLRTMLSRRGAISPLREVSESSIRQADHSGVVWLSRPCSLFGSSPSGHNQRGTHMLTGVLLHQVRVVLHRAMPSTLPGEWLLQQMPDH